MTMAGKRVHRTPRWGMGMAVALVCVLVPVLSGPTWAQQGYARQANKVVIDSPTQWQRWQSVATTVEITDAGVRPTFIRKSTRVDADGGVAVVPGVNAVVDAAAFGGGVRAAGSGAASADGLIDGRMNTYWEPALTDRLEDWWVQVDLGRTVSATRIVLKFVDEDLGDPFLHFKVTTSQGEVTVGPMIFRTRFTTSRPVRDERVFEIDLTAQLPSKWTNVYGDFTGDVIRYIGIGVTDSDYGKAREVSRTTYDSLPPEQQGDVEYFRLDTLGRPRLLHGKEAWDILAGTDRQGPVAYYRRERPRLAEVEVWTIGDNIGTGVLQRGGTLKSASNNGAEAAVVDGDFFGEVAYWSAVGGYNPNAMSPYEPVDQERQLVIDLGGAFFLDNIRILQMNALVGNTDPFPQYRIQLSDGSTNAGGSLAWKTVGVADHLDISYGPNSQRYNDFKFPLTKAKHFSFTYRLYPNDGSAEFVAQSFALSEIQFFGEGYMPEVQIASVFGGEAPFIELAATPQNLTTIEWDADLPPGTDLVLQTRTGNTVLSVTHYHKKNGSQYPGSEEEAKAAYDSDKRFFGESSVGPIVAEVIPGSDWSGWSQRYVRSGQRITSPSPRRYVAVRAILFTDNPMAAPTLRAVSLNFVRPVALTLAAEVLPSRLQEIGRTQSFSYVLRSTFGTDSRGFDEILVEAPKGLDMKLEQVVVDVTGQPTATYPADSDELDIVMDASDSLWVRLPAPVKTTNGTARIELHFESTPYNFNSYFVGSAGHSDFPGSWQRADDGDANGVSDSETTVALALHQGDVLAAVELSSEVVTPNGDGVHDDLSVRFSVMRVSAPTPMVVEVYDLSGRLVSRVQEAAVVTGRHAVTWSGVDRAGVRVPPGIYILRIAVAVDAQIDGNTSIQRLVHVAY